MPIGGGTAFEIETQVAGSFSHLEIKIVFYFHVLTYETNRVHQHILDSCSTQRNQMFQNVWSQPGLCWWTTSALVDKVIILQAQGRGYQSTGFF
jgi:hypothetical protein